MRNIFRFMVLLCILIQDSILLKWSTVDNCTNTYNKIKSNFYNYSRNEILENVVPNKTHSTNNILHILPYRIGTVYTGFLIRYSNISFTTISQTFTAPCRIDNYSNILKGKFDTGNNSNEVFYDCIEPCFLYLKELLIFEFEHVEKRKYIVRVPHNDVDVPYFSANNINTLKIFFYVDITYPNSFILKIQIAPERLNVTSYEIKVQRKTNDFLDSEQTFNIPANKSENGVIDFFYPASIPGNYTFFVRPIDSFDISGEVTFLTIEIYFLPLSGPCILLRCHQRRRRLYICPSDHCFQYSVCILAKTYIFLIAGGILLCMIIPLCLVVLYNYYKPVQAAIKNPQQSNENIIVENIYTDEDFYINFNPHRYNLTGLTNIVEPNHNNIDPDITRMIRAIQEPLLSQNR